MKLSWFGTEHNAIQLQEPSWGKSLQRVEELYMLRYNSTISISLKIKLGKIESGAETLRPAWNVGKLSWIVHCISTNIHANTSKHSKRYNISARFSGKLIFTVISRRMKMSGKWNNWWDDSIRRIFHPIFNEVLDSGSGQLIRWSCKYHSVYRDSSTETELQSWTGSLWREQNSRMRSTTRKNNTNNCHTTNMHAGSCNLKPAKRLIASNGSSNSSFGCGALEELVSRHFFPIIWTEWLNDWMLLFPHSKIVVLFRVFFFW